MKQQEFLLENYSSFNLRDIFECGHCIWCLDEAENRYTCAIGNIEIIVCITTIGFLFKGVCENYIVNTVIDYFDLDRDYNEIKRILAKVDNNMKESIKYGEGIRILNQDLWETIISFIISANNNIPRIKGIIERLSKKYGRKIKYNNKEYYTFPTPEELSNVSVQEYRELGLGFRDSRLYETTKMILNKDVDISKLNEIKDTNQVRDELLKLSGVGPKVADCILLFSTLKRFDVFPIDVWVRRVMNDLYIHKEDEKNVSKKEILKLANDKFGNLEGIAQQYLFYWRRELG